MATIAELLKSKGVEIPSGSHEQVRDKNGRSKPLQKTPRKSKDGTQQKPTNKSSTKPQAKPKHAQPSARKHKSQASSAKGGRENSRTVAQAAAYDQILVRDLNGRVCAYLSKSQLSKLKLRYAITDGIVTLLMQADIRTRIALLEESLKNPNLDEIHRQKVDSLLTYLKVDSSSRQSLRTQNDSRLSKITVKRAVAREHTFSSKVPNGYIARDPRGLYLGLHTEQGAKRQFGEVTRIGRLLCVRKAVSINRAVSCANSTTVETSWYGDRVYESMTKALSIDRTIGSIKLKDRKSVVVNVLYKDDNPVCTATQALVEDHFGPSWFLVDNATVQLVLDWGEQMVLQEARAAMTEFRSRYLDANPGDIARPKMVVDVIDSEEAQERVAHTRQVRPAYKVTLADGTPAYECGERKGSSLQWYLRYSLPYDSFELVDGGIRLTQELSDLGFDSLRQFQAACASRGKIELKDTIESGRSVSFDGRSNTLYVFKGISACLRMGHRLEGATGIVATLDGAPGYINVNYCPQCQTYFIGADEYRFYQDALGVMLGNFRFDGYSRGSGFDDLAPVSPLKLCGYNVSEAEDLSPAERRDILACVMDMGILSKPQIIRYLNGFISRGSNNFNMWIAVSKWEDDLDWVREYRIDSQRHFIIGDVQSIR